MNNKYQNGKIYLIYSKDYPLIYYGSTCKTLDERMGVHENNYKCFMGGKHNYVTSFEIITLGNYDILLVEDFPCNSRAELDKREVKYIKNNYCLCVNKNIPGRTIKEWNEDNRETNTEENLDDNLNPIKSQANETAKKSQGYLTAQKSQGFLTSLKNSPEDIIKKERKITSKKKINFTEKF